MPFASQILEGRANNAMEPALVVQPLREHPQYRIATDLELSAIGWDEWRFDPKRA